MSNLKPFDLERWRAGEKIQYRDGKEVLDMHYFNHEFVSWPIHALAWDGSLTGHRQNGSFSAIDIEHVRDIVMSPKKVIYYYASYEADRNRGVRHVTDMYRDKDHVHKMPLDGLSPIFHEIEIEE